MKKLLITFLVCLGLNLAHSQCKESISGQTIKAGMYILCNTAGGTLYVGEITSVNAKSFTCTFLKSGKTYEFTNPVLSGGMSVHLTNIAVIKNGGGTYKTGTIFNANFFMRDPDSCDLASVSSAEATKVFITFPDNKCYLANFIIEPDGTYHVKFLHSNSYYTFTRDWKVAVVDGGKYAVGDEVIVKHARLLTF